jgi:hypothetical protein
MASKIEKAESFKKAFVIKAVPFLTEIHRKCSLGYNGIEMTKLSKTHGVSTATVPAMVDLTILSRMGKNKHDAKFHWKTDVAVTKELAEKIYDKINLDVRIKKANDKLALSKSAEFKRKHLVPITGTKRSVETKDHVYNILILRAMSAVYSETKDGSVRQIEHIRELIQKEICNDTLSDRITKALVDGNYIGKKFIPGTTTLYGWIESAPTEEHAAFINDMIKETTGDDKVNRVFNMLMYLSTFKTYTLIKLRNKIKEYKLFNNDQSVLTTEVLDFTGNKMKRMYKWKLEEAPSMKLAAEISEKCRVYGSKYQNKKNKSSKKIVPDIAADSISVIVKSPFQKKEDPLFKLKTAVDVMESLRNNILDELRLKQQKLDEIDIKINEGKSLINLKEKEQTFLASCSVYGYDDKPASSQKFKNATIAKAVSKDYNAAPIKDIRFINHLPGSRIKGQRHSHNKKKIVEALAKGALTLSQMKEHFYPKEKNEKGKAISWSSDEAKSLSAMLYYLKRTNVIKSPSLGVYELTKELTNA